MYAAILLRIVIALQKRRKYFRGMVLAADVQKRKKQTFAHWPGDPHRE